MAEREIVYSSSTCVLYFFLNIPFTSAVAFSVNLSAMLDSLRLVRPFLRKKAVRRTVMEQALFLTAALCIQRLE